MTKGILIYGYDTNKVEKVSKYLFNESIPRFKYNGYINSFTFMSIYDLESDAIIIDVGNFNGNLLEFVNLVYCGIAVERQGKKVKVLHPTVIIQLTTDRIKFSKIVAEYFNMIKV